MGFEVPAALGAKVGAPDKNVWSIAGDGGFQMTLCELATIVENNIKVKFALLNNNHLGMITQWQGMFFNEDYQANAYTANPDFVKLANAYGMKALSVDNNEDVRPAIREANSHDGPFLIDFKIKKEENVFPMIPSGQSVNELLEEPLMVATNTGTRTVIALVENKAGVLARICGLFRRQGFNIASLAVGRSEIKGLSRMTFVVEGPEEVVRLVAAKLDRLIEVVEVEDISDLDHVYREMVLIKVSADNEKRGEILQLSNIFNVKTVDVGSDQMTIETTGESNEIESLLELLEPYGIIEVMRTGRVAVLKSNE